MDEGPTDDDKDEIGSNLIRFPNGKKVDPSDVGADYIINKSGDIPIFELIDPEEGKEEVRKRNKYVENQPIVRAARNNATTGEMVDVLVSEIAEELSHLKWERKRAIKAGKGASNISFGRINSLQNMANLLLKRREADRDEELDLKSPRFQAVFKVWMEFFNESMEKAGVKQEVIDLVFQQMKADMLDWEKKMSEAK